MVAHRSWCNGRGGVGWALASLRHYAALCQRVPRRSPVRVTRPACSSSCRRLRIRAVGTPNCFAISAAWSSPSLSASSTASVEATSTRGRRRDAERAGLVATSSAFLAIDVFVVVLCVPSALKAASARPWTSAFGARREGASGGAVLVGCRVRSDDPSLVLESAGGLDLLTTPAAAYLGRVMRRDCSVLRAMGGPRCYRRRGVLG
jgi:hypothetical protein